MAGRQMLGRGFDTLVEQRHLVCIRRVRAFAVFREVGESVREAEVIGCDALVPFHQPFEQGAEVDVCFGRLAHPGADRVECIQKIRGERVFEVRRERSTCELVLNRIADLLAESGKFGGHSEKHLDEFFLA